MTNFKDLIPELDYRPFTNSDRALTQVTLYPDWDPRNRIEWVTAGMSSLRKVKESERDGNYELVCEVKDRASDNEHSSAKMFILPIIGLTFDMMYYHRTTFKAYIHPRQDDYDRFHVPGSDYDPFKHKGSRACPDCKGDRAHMIVPYLPPLNPKLYELVRGMKVEITIGPVVT